MKKMKIHVQITTFRPPQFGGKAITRFEIDSIAEFSQRYDEQNSKELVKYGKCGDAIGPSQYLYAEILEN